MVAHTAYSAKNSTVARDVNNFSSESLNKILQRRGEFAIHFLLPNGSDALLVFNLFFIVR